MPTTAAISRRPSNGCSRNGWRGHGDPGARVALQDGRRQAAEGRIMNRLERKHLCAIRWMHWNNVPILAIMIWSGLRIYWANDVYAVRISGVTLFHFFP